MSTASPRVVFVVGNAIQADNAVIVAEHLRDQEFSYFDLWQCKVVAHPSSFDEHSPAVNLRRMLSIMRFGQLRPGDVVVIPQDVGLLQRLLASRARLLGCAIVLMPDGIVARGPVLNGRAVRQLVRNTVYRCLNVLGLIEGVPGAMGGSNPDYILSWGPGWDAAFTRGKDTKIIHLGCPRMDRYDGMSHQELDRINVLVCSQPLRIPAHTRAYAKDWYAFLESLRTLDRSDVNIRIRLHPAEVKSLTVPNALRDEHVGRSLASDLNWASLVASPFSTVLVEALASSRAFVAIAPDNKFSRAARAYPIFSDVETPTSVWEIDAILSAGLKTPGLARLKDAYLSNLGRSAKLTASFLKDLIFRPNLGA